MSTALKVVGVNYAGGGSGAEFSNVLAAENINVAEGEIKALTSSRKKVVDIKEADSYLDIIEPTGANTTVSVKILTEDQIFLLHDINFPNVSEDAYNLGKIIVDALNASSLTGTFSLEYSLGKIKIISTVSNIIQFSTGVNAAHSIGNALGYDITSDTADALEHEADDRIENDNNDSYGEYHFVSKCDASVPIKAENFAGVANAEFDKMELVTVKQYQEIKELTNLKSGFPYYTLSSKITITDTNKYIDFTEDSGTTELTAVITLAEYGRGADFQEGYRNLCLSIKTALEFVSSNIFTVWFDKNTNKFNIKTNSGTIQLLWLTGTNNANGAYEVLGFNKTDTSNAITITSNNIIPSDSGKIGMTDNINYENDSLYIGVSTASDGSAIFIEKNFTKSDYGVINKDDFAWQGEVTEKDYGSDIASSNIAMNSQGRGIEIVLKSDGYYHIRYTLNGGVDWYDSTTTINSGAAYVDNWDAPTYYSDLIPKIRISDNGEGIISLAVAGSGAYASVIYTSTDLVNWSLRLTKSTSSYHRLPWSVIVNNKKAMFIDQYITSGTANSLIINLSDDSGTGFSSWADSGNSFSTTAYKDYPAAFAIQFFPSETGINQYRLISFWTNASTLYVTYTKGDGSSASTITTSVNPIIKSIAQNGNDIFVTTTSNGGAMINEFELSNDYNGGFLTINDHSVHDINDTAATLDKYQGTSNDIVFNSEFKMYKKSLLLDNGVAFVAMGVQNNVGSKTSFQLFWTKNIASGTWETSLNISIDVDYSHQELQIQYLKYYNSIVASCKVLPTAALSANFSNGIIYSKIIPIGDDGTPDVNANDWKIISYGKMETGQAGWVGAVASYDTMAVTWEETNGSYGVLKSNTLA